MIIREARSADAEEFWRLNELFNGPGVNGVGCVRCALRAAEGELVLVADAGGGLAGFLCGRVSRSACYPERTAEVTELFVDQLFRRAGVAEALMRLAEARFRAAGAGEIHLYTGVRNAAARALYEKMGYAPSEEIMYSKTP